MRLIVKLSLALVLFVSCTQNEMEGSDVIRLGVKPDAYTRASVNDVTGLVAVGNKIGVYGVKTKESNAFDLLSDDWILAPLMNNVCTKSIDTDGKMIFSEIYTYSDERNVKFCAYYPYAKVGTTGANYIEAIEGQAPLLHFTLTGEEDVMYSTPVMGSRTSPDKVLLFNHALTQLRFKLVDANGIMTNAKVSGISFDGVNTTSTLNIETGELGTWGIPSNDIKVRTSYPFSVNGQELADVKVMLQPGLPNFTLNIATDKNGTYSGIKIKPDKTATFEAGTSYLITLTFLDKTEMFAKATVQPWVMGGYGEGIVQ